MRLTGVYYTANKLAKDLGIVEEHPRSVGLIAQQVDEVFPEAVEKAPINDKYLTIKYDKMVPTLVQAIKEQQKLLKSIQEKLAVRGRRGN
jgi:exonuclease V gamma subunit